MPGTYLLLRNNKQTGPHSLEALLQHNLQAHDLIWVDGQSAGWSYPQEIESLKPFLLSQNVTEPEPRSSSARDECTQPVTKPIPTAAASSTAHIYVSFPAGMQPRATEEMPVPNLEAKAEALYQRVQAYATGRTQDTDTLYARSLDNMKQEYGAWLVKQKQKKKSNISRKKLAIAASVLIVTTTAFGISKWIQSKPVLKNPALAHLEPGTTTPIVQSQTTTVSFHPATDTFTTATTLALPKNSASPKPIAETNGKKLSVSINQKQPVTKATPVLLALDTTANTVTTPLRAETKTTAQPKVNKLVPLSQLILVSGKLSNENNELKTTQISLQNNSSETLKTVAVTIMYFKKESRHLNRETVYFYNVQPAATAVTTAAGNRRATSARFEIGAITRADGSLYLIH